jgi:hypothetical protein
VGFVKKGYFYIIDALIASIILFVTIILIISAGGRSPSKVQPYATLISFVSLMTDKELRDLNIFTVQKYRETGIINDTTVTLLEQITYWQYFSETGCTICKTYQYNVTQELAKNINDVYGVKILLNGTLIYNRSISTENNSLIHLTSQRISMVVVNTTLYGPVLFEVSLWV